MFASPAARIPPLLRVRTSSGCSVRGFLLGLESSCDDTGAALVSESGRLLGEALVTQKSARFGGVIPSFAMGFHAEALPKVVSSALKLSGVADPVLTSLRDHGVELIAVTNRPGLSGSLSVGCSFAKWLCLKNKLPMVPIHHMEAHALTPRMTHGLEFPYLTLLVSGGHCILAVAKDVKKFHVLGHTVDNSPGEVLDKIARRMKLHMLRTDLRDVAGGRALEIVAEGGDPTAFLIHTSMKQHRDCRFSFSGTFTHTLETIDSMEKELRLEHDAFLPDLPHLCASVEYAVAKHLCEKVQLGLEYADRKNLWGKNNADRVLAVSGGVAANKRIIASLEKVCHAFGCRLVAPEPKYCTDNGVMIAWNAWERYKREPEDVVQLEKVLDVQVHPRCEFGISIVNDVAEESIKCKFVSIL